MSTTIAVIAHHAASLLNFRSDWVRSLHADDTHVLCLAPDYTDEERAGVRQLGAEPIDYRLQRTGLNPFRDFVDTLCLVRVLRDLQPDITFAFSTKPVIYGTLAGWMARIPRRTAMIEGVGFVFTDSNTALSWKRRTLRKAVSLLYRIALHRAHCVIFLNADDLHDFISRGLAPKRRSRVLGGIGLDLDAWQLAPVVERPVTFILVARLLREKGILEYVEAARVIREKYPESARFLLVGGLDSNPGGLDEQEVRAWVAEGIVEWPGHTDVRPWLQQASVFVLPSWREGVPRSTQEAMALGRPIITSNAPGCRETVVNGVNGFQVPVRNVDALVNAMQSFIERPEQIAIMGSASRRLAEKRFDAKQVNRRLTAWVFDHPTHEKEI